MADVYDVIIIGGGPAGLTAALYAARRGLSTLVLSQDIGGQAATTAHIENYPGVDPIDGLELMTKFRHQAESAGAKFRLEEVRRVERQDQQFTVSSTAAQYHCRAIILAFGLTHRHLDVPGEEKFIGRGVSTCATCDAPMFKGKKVVVVGGGNSAMDAALLLAQFCPQVDIITSHSEFHGERILIERLQSTPTITIHTNGKTTAIHGDDRLTGISFSRDDKEIQVSADGIFVEIGFVVNPGLIQGIVDLDDRHQVVVDPTSNGTSVPGIFAAGDVTSINQKQIVISAGEGAKAALSAYQYLQSLGQVPRKGLVDWGVKTPLRSQTLPTE